MCMLFTLSVNKCGSEIIEKVRCQRMGTTLNYASVYALMVELQCLKCLHLPQRRIFFRKLYIRLKSLFKRKVSWDFVVVCSFVFFIHSGHLPTANWTDIHSALVNAGKLD